MTISMMRCCTVLAMLAVAAGASISRAAIPDEVDAAIAKGRAWLLSQQKPSGHWEVVEKPADDDRSSVKGIQWGGRTAIATYALIAAGEKPQNPKIQDAVKFLKQAEIRGVYALGLRAQIWHMIPKTRDLMRRCIATPNCSSALFTALNLSAACSTIGPILARPSHLEENSEDETALALSPWRIWTSKGL